MHRLGRVPHRFSLQAQVTDALILDVTMGAGTWREELHEWGLAVTHKLIVHTHKITFPQFADW
jgi:hypothetical protein